MTDGATSKINKLSNANKIAEPTEEKERSVIRRDLRDGKKNPRSVRQCLQRRPVATVLLRAESGQVGRSVAIHLNSRWKTSRTAASSTNQSDTP